MKNTFLFTLAIEFLLSASFAPAQTPEPVLYYSFDKGTVSCIGGEPVFDSSTSGYDGTLTSNTALTVGTFGNSLYFAPGRYIDVGLPVFSTMDAFQPYTISFWIKTTTEADPPKNGGGFVTQYDGSATDRELRWGTDNRSSQGYVPVWWTNGAYQAEGQTPLNDDAWHHVVFTKDANQDLTIYVDGQDDTDRSGTYPNKHTTVFQDVNTFVGTFTQGTIDCTARMDELRIYDEALDAGQIRNLYTYNDAEAPDAPVLKVDFGGYYPDGGVGPYQYVTPGWRGMTASCLERSGPVTDTFGYGDGEVTLTVDSTQENGPSWQNRSRPSTYNCYINHPIGDVANDFVFCGTPDTVVQLKLEGLPAGEHYIRTYHHDTNVNYGSVSVSLTDANGADQMISPDQPISYGGGNSAADNDPDPGIISTLPMKVVSDGTNPVIISVGPNPNYAHVSGMEITSSLPTGLNVDFQAGNGDTQDGFQPFAFPGTDPNPNGAQRMWYFSDIGRAGSASVTVSRSETAKNLNFRDRAQVTGNTQADLMEDFVCAGNDLTVTLGNLKPGTYQVTNTYHDVTLARGLVDIAVLDKQGERTVATAINQTGGDIPTAPASATFEIETDGLLPVDIKTLGSVITQNSIEIERVGEGPEGPFPLKIYLIGGQSNGDGRGDIDELSPEMAAKIGIPTYHRDGWKHLQPGLDHLSDQMHGVEISFGREMAELLPGENVAVIKYAYSSTDLAEDWNPDTGSHYETFMNTIEAALGALPDEYVPEIEGMLWIHGESDSNDLAKANAYEANLNDFIAMLRTELDAPDMAFVMSELADIPRWTYGDTVRAAEAAVAAGDSLTSLVPVGDLPFNPDGYHYNSAGLITLGERMAQEIFALTGGVVTLDGDLNGDGHVNSGDLDLVRANWGVSGVPGIEGDANDDGTVNSGDLDVVRANWGQSINAVPEPGVVCLLLGGLLLMGMRRRVW